MITKTALSAAAIASILACLLLFFDRSRVPPPSIGRQLGTSDGMLSPQECDELCRESIVPLKGASANMTDQQLQVLLVKSFGELSGKELFDAYRDSRMRVADGKLFFSTRALCQQHLSGECATLCGNTMKTK